MKPQQICVVYPKLQPFRNSESLDKYLCAREHPSFHVYLSFGFHEGRKLLVDRRFHAAPARAAIILPNPTVDELNVENCPKQGPSVT